MAERKALLIRIDPRLHDDLRRWAEADLRSLNAQIEFLLRRAVDRWRRGPEGGRPDGSHGGARGPGRA